MFRLTTLLTAIMAASPGLTPAWGTEPNSIPPFPGFTTVQANEPAETAGVALAQAAIGAADWRRHFIELCAFLVLQGLIIAAVMVGRYRRIRAEAASRESESRFRQFAELVPHAIWMASPDWKKIHFVNSAYEVVFGRDRASLHADPHSWMGSLHPEDRERMAQSQGLNSAVSIGGVELRVVRPDGSIRWVHHQAVPFRNSRGEIYLLAGIAQDITEQREAEAVLSAAKGSLEESVRQRTAQLAESEERYRTLAKSSFEGILVCDQSKILEVNGPLATMFGYTEAEMIGMDRSALFFPERRTEMRRQINKTDSKDSDPAFESLGIRKDGTRFALEFRRKPLPYQGRMVSVSAVRDISERKRVDELVQHHREELAHVLRVATMNEMATGLAHELNQPLSAIANYTRGCVLRLHSGASGDDVLEAMQLAAEQAERAGEIIRRMREFTRRREPQSSDVCLNEIARRVISILRPELRRYEVTIRLHLSDGLPDILADEIQIEQVLLNLLRNACEALAEMPPEHRRITIASEESADGGIEVSVADNGPGITRDDHGSIFDPFFTTKTDGMGMGLSISRSIIEAHGGRLTVASNGDGGLTFTFTMPVTTREGIENEQYATDCLHC